MTLHIQAFQYPVTADFIVSKIIQHNFAVRSQLVAREISKLFFVCFYFLVHCSRGKLVSLPVYLFATLPKRAKCSSLPSKSVQCL